VYVEQGNGFGMRGVGTHARTLPATQRDGKQ